MHFLDAFEMHILYMQFILCRRSSTETATRTSRLTSSSSAFPACDDNASEDSVSDDNVSEDADLEDEECEEDLEDQDRKDGILESTSFVAQASASSAVTKSQCLLAAGKSLHARGR